MLPPKSGGSIQSQPRRPHKGGGVAEAAKPASRPGASAAICLSISPPACTLSAGGDDPWKDSPMSKKGITGHDEWVVTEALATALVALEQLPEKHQPRTHMEDIRKLLAARCEPETVALHLAQAKCRLFPELDRPTIYREYGIGGDGRE